MQIRIHYVAISAGSSAARVSNMYPAAVGLYWFASTWMIPICDAPELGVNTDAPEREESRQWWDSKSFKFRGCGIMYPQQSVCVCCCASGRESLSHCESATPSGPRGMRRRLSCVCVHLNKRAPSTRAHLMFYLFRDKSSSFFFLFAIYLINSEWRR